VPALEVIPEPVKFRPPRADLSIADATAGLLLVRGLITGCWAHRVVDESPEAWLQLSRWLDPLPASLRSGGAMGVPTPK
jgi:hypothetical protein